MSTALLEPVAETTVDTSSSVEIGNDQNDPHPLLPVFVFGAIALAGACLVAGAMLATVALRHSGIFASF